MLRPTPGILEGRIVERIRDAIVSSAWPRPTHSTGHALLVLHAILRTLSPELVWLVLAFQGALLAVIPLPHGKVVLRAVVLGLVYAARARGAHYALVPGAVKSGIADEVCKGWIRAAIGWEWERVKDSIAWAVVAYRL